ncbi:hypothetical protein [Pseudomonas sp. 37 R 15]|uniref:hypothetical protein n=1 Tax=Pseudomonas sp. 37 R 15 TaxID=1844104 RepID=UPI0008129A6E|nr:hypothetical protein [Pseudomonas sp. 37 R 15]CRM65137.1 hypothetical protein [Pseudomonas sp. 37 R 15]
MRLSPPSVFMALSVNLTGCGQEYSLAPPADSEKITVTVKLPKELKTETLEVMYRSATCKSVTYGAGGQRIELDGRHGIDVQLQRQGQTDLYQAKLPIDGGGACRWRISNVMFGVTYVDPTRFGENVTFGGRGGILVKFDNNRPMRSSGLPIIVEGNLTIRGDYYPWLSEVFLGGYRKQIRLAGKGDIYVSYQALQARQIYFEPVLHSDFLVSSEGTKVHKVGSFITFIYPDGSVLADGRSTPDFRKLQAIRLAAEGK